MYQARLSETDRRTMERRAARQGYRVNGPPVRQEVDETGPQLRQAAVPGLTAAFMGIGISAPLAAALRAVLYIVVTALCDIGILYFTTTPPAMLAVYSPIIAGALRQIEGIIDGALKGDASATAPGVRR